MPRMWSLIFAASAWLCCSLLNPGCGSDDAPLSTASTDLGARTDGAPCDPMSGRCDAGGADGDAPDLGATVSGACGVYLPPTDSACCKSCSGNRNHCQTNGCYGGYWCDSTSCKCQAPPANCAGDGGVVSDNGPIDAGVVLPTTGSVGPGGGSISRLYFAVVGDTRPANEDDTANYPTTIINTIYSDIEAMSPRPEFIVGTGDYMFANPANNESAPQIAVYASAAKQFTGTLFAAMGNHECTGYTNSDCSAMATNNYNAFMATLVTPLGQTLPYYTIPMTDLAGQWTAKLVVTACNAWDATQQAWFTQQLAQPTTYTFVVRHEPSSAPTAPCVTQTDQLLAGAKYDLLIVGHSHEFSHSQRQIIVGNGGAPLSGNGDFGYATVNQQDDGTFEVTQYDYLTALPVSTFTVQ